MLDLLDLSIWNFTIFAFNAELDCVIAIDVYDKKYYWY